MSDLFIRWVKARTSLERASPWLMWFVSPSSRISHDFSEWIALDIKHFSHFLINDKLLIRCVMSWRLYIIMILWVWEQYQILSALMIDAVRWRFRWGWFNVWSGFRCPPEHCPRLMEYYEMLKDRPSIKASWPLEWLEKPEGQDTLKNLWRTSGLPKHHSRKKTSVNSVLCSTYC